MKKFCIFVLSCCVLSSLNAQTSNEGALAYNDAIVQEQTSVGVAILVFSGALNEDPSLGTQAQDLQSSYAALQEQVKVSARKINAMQAFEGNTEFLNAAKALFTFYNTTVSNEYKMIMDYMLNPLAATDTTAQGKLQSAIDRMTDNEAKLDADFARTQSAFAAKYGFTLEENDMQDDIDDEDY